MGINVRVPEALPWALSHFFQMQFFQGKNSTHSTPSRTLQTPQLTAHQTHHCAHPICSPDIGDEGEHRCPTHQKQQPPVGKAVGKPGQVHDSHREKTVFQDDGVSPVLAN